jgi:UDP-2,3-diacylglucosamine pyrophosphatase LpxH
MAVAVVADAHLGASGELVSDLIEQLESLDGERCERLLLLGDLFHVWIGNPRFETPEIAAVVRTLGRLRERSLPIDYIEGNRDFFVGRSVYADLFDSVATELSFEVDGRRFLAVHGDGINKRDYLYRFWRRLSKNPVSELAMNRLPRRLADRLIYGFERELAKTNFRHRRGLPEDVICSYAERRLREGYDVVVLGHFHQARRWEVPGGEVMVLDAWFRSRRIEWITRSTA